MRSLGSLSSKMSLNGKSVALATLLILYMVRELHSLSRKSGSFSGAYKIRR